jgi:hypothetical protein
MNNLSNSIFGPLDKKSCVYFFAWTIFFFIMLLFAFVGLLIHMFKDYKKFDKMHFINLIVMFFNLFLAYFVNRLLYTMCNKSLA